MPYFRHHRYVIMAAATTLTWRLALTTRHYVHVIGPYDNTFIGPFPSLTTANAYVIEVHNGPSRHVFNAYAMTETQFAENVARYGIVEVQPAEGYMQ